MAAAVAKEAAFGVGAAAFGLFGYNKSNFQYDAEMRYERFTSAREFAMAQMEMYRGDLRALSALTQKKNTLYAVVASLCMALCVALYCAGRLGLHGPSPPAWIMGLWYTNNAAAFSFMALAIWLACHASFRAQSASVHLLTRKARLPVPTLKQLDKARRFASEFEQQGWGDIFRVPYISNNGAPKTDAMPGASQRSRSAPAGRRTRASTWIRDEFETDRAGTVAGFPAAEAPPDLAPEHFQLYTAVQKEWFAYDVYARIAILYGLISFVHALGYYGLGHINIELRAFWVPYATGFVLMTLLALLLRFDIVRGRKERSEMLPHCQWLGPLAWLPAAVGMSLDFGVHFSFTSVAITWVLIFISYLLQLVYTLRLLEVALPDGWPHFKATEKIGASWWPETWSVPSSFQHVLYLVAPPQRLQPGQNDIVREIKSGAGFSPEDAGVDPSGRLASQEGDLQGQTQYLEHLFEQAFSEGVFSAMSAQGKAKVGQLRQQYTAARGQQGARPGADPELSRVVNECVLGLSQVSAEEGMHQTGYESAGSAYASGASSGEEAKAHVDGRRVHPSAPPFAQTKDVEPWRLVTSIVLMLCVAWVFCIFGCIMDLIVGEQGLVTAPHWSRPPMTRLSMEPHELGTPIGFPWPAGSKPFLPEQMAWHEEKRHAGSDLLGRRLQGLPSGLPEALGGLMRALGPRPEPVAWPGFFEPRLLACGPGGVAALAPRGFGAAAPRAAGRAEAFRLQGLQGPLLGASWASEGQGLLLAARDGQLLECPGPRPAEGGAWPCHPAAAPRLPGRRLQAAAAARLGPAAQLHAVLVDEAAPDLAALFVHEDGAWLPMGEVPLPGRGQPSVALAEGELFVATAGAWVRRRLVDGAILGRQAGLPEASWRASCLHPNGPVHLHLRESAGHRKPELVREPASDPVFQ